MALYQVSVLRVNAAARLESLKNDAGRKEARLQEEVVMRNPILMTISSLIYSSLSLAASKVGVYLSLPDKLFRLSRWPNYELFVPKTGKRRLPSKS